MSGLVMGWTIAWVVDGPRSGLDP